MNTENTTPATNLLSCEELFMLLLRDDGKWLSVGLAIGAGLSAAVVADARQLGRVQFDGDKNPRVSLVDPSPTGHPALDLAIRRLADKNHRRLESTVADSKLDPTKAIAAQLEANGLLVARPRLFGTRYELRDRLPTTRQRLGSGITHSPASERDATLLGIIEALGVAKTVFADVHRELGGGEFRRRMKAIAASVPEARAVENVEMYGLAAVVAATS